MSDHFKFRIGHENYLFERPEDRISLITGTVTGGAVSTLRAQQLSRQVTVASDAGGDILIRWQGGSASEPAARQVHLVALCNVEVDLPGDPPYLRLQVTRYSGSTLLDTKVVNYDWWASDGEDRKRFTPNVVCLFDTGETCDRVDIRLYGGSTAPRSAKIGPVWVGPVWAPPETSGLEVGWTMTPSDTGTVRRTASSAAVTRKRRVLRTLSGSLAAMNYSDVYGPESDWSSPTPDLQMLLHTIGTTRLVYVLPRTVTPGETPLPHTYGMFRLGFVGLATQLGSIPSLGGNQFKWDGFSFQEVQ
jgi:hypothetical protein